jgi:hypothetical protein
MSDEAFTVVYEARLHYEPQEDVSEEAAKDILKDMIVREPEFGSISFEYPEEEADDE